MPFCTAKDYNETPGNLKNVFPSLEQLEVWWNVGIKSPSPHLEIIQEWPRNLSTIRFVNLPSKSLPIIKNSQVKKLEVDHGCPNLTYIENISHLEYLEELEINCEYKAPLELPSGVFANNTKLWKLDLKQNQIQILKNNK